MFSLSHPVKGARRSARAPFLTGLVLACTWAVLPVSGAQAAQAVVTEKPCPETRLVQPFTSFGDGGWYSLVPGGGFEPAETRWTTAGPAMPALGSEPYDVTGAPGWFSMALATGGSAQSPYMCVEPNDRTFRFFLRAAGPSAAVTVSLDYKGPLGLPVVLASKNVTVGGGWELSQTLHTGAALVSNVSGGSAQLSLAFTATKGTVRIDDVYLDPRMRR